MRHELVENGSLAGTETTRAIVCLRTRLLGRANPALEPGAGSGTRQGPVEGHASRRGEGAEPPDELRPTFPDIEVADGTRPKLELSQQVPVDEAEAVVRAPVASGGRFRFRGSAGDQLGDELEPLEQAGRQQRSHDDRDGRQVGRGDPLREREGQGRQERPVGANPVDHRLRDNIHRAGGLTHDDPERLPSPELDEDRLAGQEVAERRRNRIRIGPPAGATRGIDGDFDKPRRVTRADLPGGAGDGQLIGRCGRDEIEDFLDRVGRHRPIVAGCPCRERLGHEAGASAAQTTTCRSGLVRRSVAMISSIRAAVRSTCPVSFTIT